MVVSSLVTFASVAVFTDNRTFDLMINWDLPDRRRQHTAIRSIAPHLPAILLTVWVLVRTIL